MASRCLNLLKNFRTNFSNNINYVTVLNYSSVPISNVVHEIKNINKKEYQTENNIKYLGDPDTFGTLAGNLPASNKIEDEDDIKEEQHLQNIPLKTQKLTIRQYADIIKQYVEHKRIKTAIDVLETRMLKEDRVKPENYIYNILIGACADVGYTKKAFKLYNDMKRRALKPTGDTYTCLFQACINSPWPSDGLKMATHLRNFMIEKGIEPNLTNYNVMVKAFGRCSDLPMAFKIVDEMISKKIKIRVHTFNHLLHACINDKESGLKHALLVWRKMLQLRETPNIYSFNLMLKCVKECNLGSKADIMEVIDFIQKHNKKLNLKNKPHQIESPVLHLNSSEQNKINDDKQLELPSNNYQHQPVAPVKERLDLTSQNSSENTVITVKNEDSVRLEFIDSLPIPLNAEPRKTVPNLLSQLIHIDHVTALQEVNTPQDKFAIVGGQDDFLREMKAYSVKPDIKTFTQMLPLIENSLEAERKLLEALQSSNIKTDIDFYNMLIKKRCLRRDYESAFDVMKMIEEQNKLRQKHPWNKKKHLKVNIMTYGILALACNTREKAEKLLNEMIEKQLKTNIEILGTLLRNGASQMQFGYVLYIMDIVKQENLKINEMFIKHLETFNDRCLNIIQKNEREARDSPILVAAYNRFSKIYRNWLIEINAEEAIKPEHPWKQFSEAHPSTIQRENFHIVEPKKFYKRNRKFIRYVPKI